METKKCTRCNEEKQLSEFGVNKHGKQGLRAYCKQCRSEIAKDICKSKVLIYKYMANNKGQLPTDYSDTFINLELALDWYKNFGKNCERLFKRKLYLAEITQQKQYR